ncbi:hypothetical protein [Aurantiacibacter aquimixticola]|uniref:GDT1 family protein n=1 Tax=Aurantiacibacter aquimixticola TaxID=1958945 RepID=A0A419RVW4_9SPHN|nr:hypothetical protein [Aurantiacibacter aquimixticola]RJY09919.1 hypothetical protein D6201_11680 [Aurantiacibacter aquimixticola]
MTGLFLSFLAIAAVLLAGREAVRVARFAAAGASTVALVAIATLVAIAASAAAAWLAGGLSAWLAPEHRTWLVAAALALAGLEVLLLRAPETPREPTRSLGALALVLFAGVLADASGLLLISLAILTEMPVPVAVGGGLAAGGVLGMAALAGADWEKLPRAVLRWTIGPLLLLAAPVIAFLPGFVAI